MTTSSPLSLRDMRAWRRATAQYREVSSDPEPIDVLLDIAEAAAKAAERHHDRDLALALAKLGQDGAPR